MGRGARWVRGGEEEHPKIAVDGGDADEPEGGAIPAAVGIQVRWCSHDKKVSFMEEALVCVFPYSERERAEKGDQAWATRESGGAIGGRRKARAAIARKTLGRNYEDAMYCVVPSPSASGGSGRRR